MVIPRHSAGGWLGGRVGPEVGGTWERESIAFAAMVSLWLPMYSGFLPFRASSSGTSPGTGLFSLPELRHGGSGANRSAR